MTHIPVLLRETIEALALTPSQTVVDATHGAGGHAIAICKKLDSTGTYIGIDADPTALEDSPLNDYDAANKPTLHLVNNNFSHLTDILRSLHIRHIHTILADLGWRSDQFESGGRGFSFQTDEPLLMTYGRPEDYPFTAYDIVNEWAEESIADVIYGYGEEHAARRIARAIVKARASKSIKTAVDLVTVVESVLPRRPGQRLNPATKTFQALRIAVNDELGVLERFIAESYRLLEPKGRLAIISFHSLEDRVVKLAFREYVKNGGGELYTKKPISPSREEIISNPRARSAKLRVLIKS
jgi:16S rRNA (cytosine1402-N4)-methyltransferase